MREQRLKAIIGRHEDAVAEEIYQRYLDLLHATGREKIKEKLKSIGGCFVSGEDCIDWQFKFEIIVNDIYQIVGRLKREKAKRQTPSPETKR